MIDAKVMQMLSNILSLRSHMVPMTNASAANTGFRRRVLLKGIVEAGSCICATWDVVVRFEPWKLRLEHSQASPRPLIEAGPQAHDVVESVMARTNIRGIVKSWSLLAASRRGLGRPA